MKSQFTIVCFLVVSAVSPLLRAAEPGSSLVLRPASAGLKLSGNARIDFVGFRELLGGPDRMQDSVFFSYAQTQPSRKSPWLAAGLSLVLPGTGEFYAESYWKSAAFLAVEVTLWTFAYIYDKKGDRQTDFFQNFANDNWSVVKYAQYADDHLKPAGGTYNWLIPGTEGRRPWERVNWAELNKMERDIAGYYSHVLPPYGEQQYYELIGKYPQFNQGWDDAPANFAYGDPLTSHFLYYSNERGKANVFYETATTMVTIALANHIVSAVDAALTTASYNKGLHADVGARTIPTETGMRMVPVLNLRYGF